MITVNAGESWAECGVLRVGFLPRAPAGRSFDLGNRVAVLVPNNTLRMTVDARAPGHRYQATVDGDTVSVLPPCSRVDVQEESPGAMLVMALDNDYVIEKLRATRRHVSGAARSVDPFLHRMGATMRSALRVHVFPSAGYLEIVARELRDHLCDAYSRERRRQAASTLGDERLERSVQFMHEHSGHKDVSVADVAASVGLSPFHFTRMFTHATGKAPHAYLTDLRVAESKKLLGDTCIAIAVIAQRVGYATHAHFTGVFGRHNGVTPARYREEVRAARAKARADTTALNPPK